MAPKNPKIGTMIRAALRRKGVKQGQVAQATGAHRTTVNKWINDKAYPQDHHVGPLEDYLGIPLPPWPPIVEKNADMYEVARIWVDVNLTLSERLEMVEDWLRRNHPERLEDPGAALLAL
jgi:transcriptional regulator with XRE-family HTH domain